MRGQQWLEYCEISSQFMEKKPDWYLSIISFTVVTANVRHNFPCIVRGAVDYSAPNDT